MLKLNTVDPLDTSINTTYMFDPKTYTIYNPDGSIADVTNLQTICDMMSDKLKVKKFKQLPSGIKHNTPTHIRIALGTNCNFSCKYCKQPKTVMSHEYSDEEIESFIEKFKTLDTSKLRNIQFWGGEPLLYKRTIFKLLDGLKPLVNNDTSFFTLSNGSLWTKEFVDIALQKGLYLGISHDGPGQCYRSADPLKLGSVSNDAIMYYWNTIKDTPENHFTVLVTMTNENTKDFAETEKFFVDRFGESIWTHINFLPLIIEDKEYVKCSILNTDEKNVPFKMLKYLISLGGIQTGFVPHILNIAKAIVEPKYIISDDQVSCFIASPNVLAMDIYGHVLPCQNFTDHILGDITDISSVKIPEYIKLKDKQTNCETCPVVTVCMGGCPLVKQEHLSDMCKNNFSFFIGIFAYVIFIATGKIITTIDGDFSCRDI